MKKYSIIYADPPWRYKVYSKKGLGRSAESHYPTMELEDIRALPVGTLAADDCVLFLWTTIPLLHDCFSVMRAWGFSYKTVAFVWIKQNRKSDSLFWGMGHWTRANAEFCMRIWKSWFSRAMTRKNASGSWKKNSIGLLMKFTACRMRFGFTRKSTGQSLNGKIKKTER